MSGTSFAGRDSVDVLFIHPGGLTRVYQTLASSIAAIEPPTFAALCAEYLRRNGLGVQIIDAAALQLSLDDLARVVAEDLAPKLVVLAVYGLQPSASTQMMPAAGAAARAVKRATPDMPIMMIGAHPAALPERTLAEEWVDYVCDREGPETILLTLQALASGRHRLHSVPSLWYQHHGRIVHNPPADLIKDLDSVMPSPAFDLLPMGLYRAHNWHCFDHLDQRQPYASLYSSFGCPFECSFCCINAPFGRPAYRMWRPETVLAQIDRLVEVYGVRNIKIVDEMFVLNARHVEQICDLLIERGYDLNIWAYARVDTVKTRMLPKLRAAGFRWLALGIESGSQQVRDGVQKGRFGAQDILAVVRAIQAVGIHVIGNYIFGLPDDTRESMEQTLQLALEANCEFANFYAAMAYPGSPLYARAIAEHWELPDSWIGYSQHSYESCPLPTATLTSADVLRFRDEAFARYFSEPRYLDRVRDLFGQDVVRHLSEVTATPLPRKLYGPGSPEAIP